MNDLELKLQGVNDIGAYRFENVRMMAQFDLSAATTNPIPDDDVYKNWISLLVSTPGGNFEVTDKTKVAGMSIFNADSLMFAGQSKLPAPLL